MYDPNQPYGNNPHQPPPSYGPGYPGHGQRPPGPTPDGQRTNAIVSLILNLLSLVACCNIFGIGGAILSGLALGRAHAAPERAKLLNVWSWVLFGGGLVLSIGTIIVLGVNGAFDE
ncbi:hypothetical protein [Nonomuraea longicatena]|uniref:DUF4190 domain-containing protein n=1 Tax=Nonomuraea longicatena TaxID=83682 RepID=A0ABP4BA48_9ACTN